MWCGRGSCYGNKISLRYLSNSRSKSFVADEDLHGRNILLLTSFCYVNCSCRYLRERYIYIYVYSNWSQVKIGWVKRYCFLADWRLQWGKCVYIICINVYYTERESVEVQTPKHKSGWWRCLSAIMTSFTSFWCTSNAFPFMSTFPVYLNAFPTVFFSQLVKGFCGQTLMKPFSCHVPPIKSQHTHTHCWVCQQQLCKQSSQLLLLHLA